LSGATESGGAGGFRARAGALTLLYLVTPMERSVLRAMLAEAATGVEVVDDFVPPDPEDPIDIAVITDPYMVEPADPDLGPGEIDEDTLLKPTPAGRELLVVAPVLERWLGRCPEGPLALEPDAGPVLSALLGGWCSMVVHALAAGPLAIEETVEALVVLSRETVEERIGDLVEAGLLDVLPGGGGVERFAVTEWLRMAIAPLAVAARLELRHPPGDTAPISARDVEAAFHLTLPLLELPGEMSGTCSLAVDLDKDVPGSPAGVTVRVERGEVVSCETGLEEVVDAWAAASAGDWLDTVIEPKVVHVRTGGNRNLARRLLHELHELLFGVAVG
jgi:hypothetical protein